MSKCINWKCQQCGNPVHGTDLVTSHKTVAEAKTVIKELAPSDCQHCLLPVVPERTSLGNYHFNPDPADTPIEPQEFAMLVFESNTKDRSVFIVHPDGRQEPISSVAFNLDTDKCTVPNGTACRFQVLIDAGYYILLVLNRPMTNEDLALGGWYSQVGSSPALAGGLIKFVKGVWPQDLASTN